MYQSLEALSYRPASEAINSCITGRVGDICDKDIIVLYGEVEGFGIELKRV